MAKGDLPNFHVHAMDKSIDTWKSRIGAAWMKPDGSISISLNPFVSLRASPNLMITLFPNRENMPYDMPHETNTKPPAIEPSEISKAAERFKRGKSGDPLDDDGPDIPF